MAHLPGGVDRGRRPLYSTKGLPISCAVCSEQFGRIIVSAVMVAGLAG
jgi:hypothetical protein